MLSIHPSAPLKGERRQQSSKSFSFSNPHARHQMVAVSGKGEGSRRLNAVNVSPLAPLNRPHAFIYSLAILSLLYHRCSSLFRSTDTFSLFLLSLTIADLVFAFLWALSQALRWRPVLREEFPEALERAVTRETWPGLDVFICTADPFKEPPLSVTNTALSAMAFDYPTDQLSVYVSDDGCSPLTMFAFIEAARFAKYWLPFCRERGLVNRCPEAYFKSDGQSEKIKVRKGLFISSERPSPFPVRPLVSATVSRDQTRDASYSYWGVASSFIVCVIFCSSLGEYSVNPRE